MATSSLSGTGNQPYTTARIDYLATYFQGQLPGLSHDAAVKWIRAEQGVNGNVLGVTYRDSTGQHLYKYASQEAGLRAAAGLVKSSSNYSGIRASLPGGDVTAQLKAIAASPWNAPSHYRSGATFGVSVPNAVSGGASSAVATPTAILAALPGFVTLSSLLGMPDSTVVTSDNIKMLDQKVKDLEAAGKIDHSTAQNLLQTLGDAGVLSAHGGKRTLGSIQVRPSTGTSPGIPDYASQGFGLGIDLGAIVDPQNWAYFGAIIIGLPLTLLGFYLLAGVPTGGKAVA